MLCWFPKLQPTLLATNLEEAEAGSRGACHLGPAATSDSAENPLYPHQCGVCSRMKQSSLVAAQKTPFGAALYSISVSRSSKKTMLRLLPLRPWRILGQIALVASREILQLFRHVQHWEAVKTENPKSGLRIIFSWSCHPWVSAWESWNEWARSCCESLLHARTASRKQATLLSTQRPRNLPVTSRQPEFSIPRSHGASPSQARAAPAVFGRRLDACTREPA